MLSKNTLVMYKGGGYDGCIFEYNYAYIDTNGEFHNIASSGYKGCDTLGQLKYAYSERPEDFDFYRLCKSKRAKETKRFGREAPISHLIRVAQFFQDWGFPEIVFPVKCEECGKQCLAADAKGDGLRGCGGIAMQYNRIVCLDCAERLEDQECEDCGATMRELETLV